MIHDRICKNYRKTRQKCQNYFKIKFEIFYDSVKKNTTIFFLLVNSKTNNKQAKEEKKKKHRVSFRILSHDGISLSHIVYKAKQIVLLSKRTNKKHRGFILHQFLQTILFRSYWYTVKIPLSCKGKKRLISDKNMYNLSTQFIYFEQGSFYINCRIAWLVGNQQTAYL